MTNRTWNHILAALNPIAKRFGLYTAYLMTSSDYLGTVRFPLGLHDAKEYLRENGYSRNPIASAKFHTKPHSAVDHGSYRRVPDSHPDELLDMDDPPEIATKWEPHQTQYHVHLYPSLEGVEFFSHYEVRGDIVRGDWDIGRMRTHYRPVPESTIFSGLTDLNIDSDSQL